MIATKQHLTQLESTGLLRMAQTHPELEYLFRHALVQDAAYESLLIADRQKLHLKVGEALEQLYPDRLDELAPVLGQHFSLAGDEQHALKYFTLAGDIAFAANANTEAITHYTQALTLAEAQIDLPDHQLIHLFTHLGRALELIGQFDKAEANYNSMRDLAAGRNNQVLDLAGVMGLATIYAIPGATFDPERGQTLCQQAMALAEALDDKAAQAKIQWNLMLICFFSGSLQEGALYGQQSLALARELNLREQLAYTLNDLAGYYYFPGGQYKAGQAAMAEAREIWQALGNQSMLADNLATSAFNDYLAGNFTQSHALSTRAYRLNVAIANIWGQAYSQALAGMVEMEWGQSQQSIQVLKEAINKAEQVGFAAGQVIAGGMLAVQYELLGAFQNALEVAQKAVALAESQIGFWKPHALGSLALIYIRQNNLPLAVETLQHINLDDNSADKFIMSYIMAMLAHCELGLVHQEYERVITSSTHFLTKLRHHQVQAYLPYLLYYQAQAFLARNRPQQALQTLYEARILTKKLEARHIQWPILFMLSQLEPDVVQAEQWHQQVREIIDYIINHTPADLRASFLNLPKVQMVLRKQKKDD